MILGCFHASLVRLRLTVEPNNDILTARVAPKMFWNHAKREENRTTVTHSQKISGEAVKFCLQQRLIALTYTSTFAAFEELQRTSFVETQNLLTSPKPT